MSMATLVFAPPILAVILMRSPPYSNSSRIRSVSNAANVELDAIVCLHFTYLTEDADHGFRIRIAKAEKIEIACRTKRVVEPRCYQHCAFQDEAVSMRSLTEAVEQPLKYVACEQKVEGLLAFSGNVQQ